MGQFGRREEYFGTEQRRPSHIDRFDLFLMAVTGHYPEGCFAVDELVVGQRYFDQLVGILDDCLFVYVSEICD